jgi:ubiquinone/menaquinone biosynthesis C-methylase UbiE
MKRIPSHELLDSDEGTPEEVAASLADLRFVNRWFGGGQTTQSLLRRVIAASGRRMLSMLEVAAGSGDVPLATQRALRAEGIDLAITALDRSTAHLPTGIPRVVGDALALPFPDNSFDVVSCGLFAHHLSPPEFVRFATEAIRVAGNAVLINDLIRHPLHLALVYAGLPLYRSRLTRNDAPASVRQAYTLDEMQTMLKQTPAARIEITRHYLFRMGVIAWKRA